MTTIQQLMPSVMEEKFSNKIPPSPPSPPPTLPLFPSPHFPHKQVSHTQGLTSFTNVAHRFSPYTYPNRYSSSLLTSPYSPSIFHHFPQPPFLHFPLPTPELERSHSPVLPDSPASPIVLERNEYCREEREGGMARH
jgi:hypothetical protein